MKKFLKKPWVIILAVAIIIIAGYFLTHRKVKTTYETFDAKKTDLIQEVSVTGQVKSAEEISLAFETGGKVSTVSAKVSDLVKRGQRLAAINSNDLIAQLAQAQAGVASAKAALGQKQAAMDTETIKLAEMKGGNRNEEIQISETAAANAQSNLDNVKNQASVDLAQSYDSAISAAQGAISVARNSLLFITDLQYSHFSSDNQYGPYISDAKGNAIYILFGAVGAGNWAKEYISTLQGGAYASVQNALANPTAVNMDQAILVTLDGLRKTKAALDVVPITSALSSIEQTNLNTEKTNISTQITALSGKQQALDVQKSTNNYNITTAQSTLNSAQDELALTKAGYAAEKITAQEAAVRQAEANVAAQQASVLSAEANVQNTQAQLAKTVILSPIDGIVTKVDINPGEITSANKTIISVIAIKQFEIEANVSEVDIAKIKIGDTAKVTLDAYGSDTAFGAKVIAVDPAETVIDGVSTYKVTFQFTEENEQIKSGMTANLDVLTDQKTNVIVVPQRAVLTKNGDKIVRILKDAQIVEERKVTTGIRGSDGNIEITSGLNEGDKVIITIKTN